MPPSLSGLCVSHSRCISKVVVLHLSPSSSRVTPASDRRKASFDGRTALADFESSASRMQAVVGEGGLTGTFGNEKNGMHAFKAAAFCTCGFVGEAGPEIMGSWEVSENNWKLSVRRAGEDTIATISRGGNEIGPLSGRFNGAFFELSFFDGSRAAVLEIEPRKDGGLDLSWIEPGIAVKKVKAVRAGSNGLTH